MLQADVFWAIRAERWAMPVKWLKSTVQLGFRRTVAVELSCQGKPWLLKCLDVSCYPALGPPGMTWSMFASGITLVCPVNAYRFWWNLKPFSPKPCSHSGHSLNFRSCGQKSENEQTLWEQVLRMFVICFLDLCPCFLWWRSFLSSGEEWKKLLLKLYKCRIRDRPPFLFQKGN